MAKQQPVRPIFHAEQCHTGGHLCRHNHRTVSGAMRCLPAVGSLGQGAYSMARVLPQNAAAQRLLDEQDNS